MRKHLTKTCTMISQAQRIDAALRLSLSPEDIDPKSARSRQQQKQAQRAQQAHQQQQAFAGMPPLNLDMLQPQQSQQSWTRLEALAEVSRRMDREAQHPLSGAEPVSGAVMSDHPSEASAPAAPGPFQVHEQFAFSSPQSTPHKDQPQSQDKQGQSVAFSSHHPYSDPWCVAQSLTLSFPDDIDFGSPISVEAQAHSASDATTSTGGPNVSVAAAATERLNTGELLDPTLFHDPHRSADDELRERLQQVIGSVEHDQGNQASHGPVTPPPASHDTRPVVPFSINTAGFNAPVIDNGPPSSPGPQSHSPTSKEQAPTHSSYPSSGSTQLPWGQITFGASTTLTTAATNMPPMMGMPSRSVFRLDANGNKGRHSRSRFSEPRRKEVQNIRKIGACIRCRILRKTCSKGDPCETCQKVLSPRIWRSGCIRTKFTDKVDLFNARVHEHQRKAGVDAVMANWNAKYPIVVLEATHSDGGVMLACEASLGTRPDEILDPTVTADYQTVFPKVVMIDPEDDLPERMKEYVNDVLPELIRLEESTFSRITLEAAQELASKNPERNLLLALELWACVEIIERELKWNFNVRPSPTVRSAVSGPITNETDPETYKMLGLQLTAAAEQRAEVASKELLKHMQRDLQDARVPMDEHMFFATLLLLISIEKSTWAFKIWDQTPSLRENWPHPEKQPSEYTGQGDELAELLRMLLTIRKAMPKIEVRESDGVLTVADPGSFYHSYFEHINLKGKLF